MGILFVVLFEHDSSCLSEDLLPFHSQFSRLFLISQCTHGQYLLNRIQISHIPLGFLINFITYVKTIIFLTILGPNSFTFYPGIYI